MGTLYLVRHGQASFGADDYDKLCELGTRQSRRLGEYFAAKGMRFDAAIHGTLRRHLQTFEGIRAGMDAALPEPLSWPGLNEYDSAALIAAVHPAPLERADTPEKFRRHFQILRQALAQWMRGAIEPVGMPSYAAFQEGVAGALAHVRSRGDGNVLLVSSGGPIATAVGQVLGLAPEITIELNLRMRNSCVTEFHFNAKRCSLITFNTLPHLDGPQYADWVTHA